MRSKWIFPLILTLFVIAVLATIGPAIGRKFGPSARADVAAHEEGVRAEKAQVRKQTNASNAAEILDQIVYFKDGRAKPPVCIGFFWRGGYYGGPAAFTVPCESVEHLIDQK